MKNLTQISKWSLLALISLLSACTEDEGPVTDESQSNQITNVSYSADIQPIFTARCVACHDEFHPTGLNLKPATSYGLLVNVVTKSYSPKVRIKPFSKEESVLLHKIKDDGLFGGKMPRIGDPLTSFEIKKIEKWIELGALNN